MKKLVTTDVFSGARLIKELNLKKEVEDICKEADDINDIFHNGFEVVYMIFEKAIDERCELKIYEFLSRPYEMTPEEVGNLEIDKQFEMLEQLAKENDLKAFFSKVKKFINSMK